MGIRFAAEADAPALLAIYAQYIETGITFECALPSREEFARTHPRSSAGPIPIWSGRRTDGSWAMPTPTGRRSGRPTSGMRSFPSIWTGTTPAPAWGAGCTTALMALLRLQGVRTVYALVTLPNEKSEGLHRSMGFRLMGVQRSTGYKDGAWRDVAWFELPIAPYDQDPAPLCPLPQVPLEQVAAGCGRHEGGEPGSIREKAGAENCRFRCAL